MPKQISYHSTQENINKFIEYLVDKKRLHEYKTYYLQTKPQKDKCSEWNDKILPNNLTTDKVIFIKQDDFHSGPHWRFRGWKNAKVHNDVNDMKDPNMCMFEHKYSDEDANSIIGQDFDSAKLDDIYVFTTTPTTPSQQLGGRKRRIRNKKCTLRCRKRKSNGRSRRRRHTA